MLIYDQLRLTRTPGLLLDGAVTRDPYRCHYFLIVADRDWRNAIIDTAARPVIAGRHEDEIVHRHQAVEVFFYDDVPRHPISHFAHQLIAAAAVCKAVDPQRAITPLEQLRFAAAILATFPRIRHGPADETVRVIEHVANGAAVEGPIVPEQHDIRQQDASGILLGSATRLLARHTTRNHFVFTPQHERRRALAASGAILARASAFRRSTSSISAAVRSGQTASVSTVSPSKTRGRRISASCASGGSTTGGPSKQSLSLAPTSRSTMLRSSRVPAARACTSPFQPAKRDRAWS